MKKLLSLLSITLLISCSGENEKSSKGLRLWYTQPANSWTEALPVGNGRLGAMVFGGVTREHIQFNEETLWKGEPNDYSNHTASKYLDDIRKLLFEGKQRKATQLAMEKFMSIPLRQKEYQPFGDLLIDFPFHENYSDYERELDLSRALCKTSYKVNDVTYNREVFASNPDQVITIHLSANKKRALNFSLRLDAVHEQKSIVTDGNQQTLNVAVKDGVLKGKARLKVETDGNLKAEEEQISVSDANSAVIYLSAATNYLNYKDVSKNPETELDRIFSKIENKTFKKIAKEHFDDYQSLFNRFNLSFGTNGKDTLPTDKRLTTFWNDPNDPSFIALYVQYARYLMISSSRPGTQPANLQGIWNDRLIPPWGSKYTANINVEMNYWPAEITNLSECHEPLFKLIEDCTESGSITARKHYNCDGWVLHHNTDIWRGTAPINHANHGIWVTGGAWLAHHMWEHYLFTQDKEFLAKRAYPVMRNAAEFFTEFLIPDPKTGLLISTPSNSPENGGLVAGPTMDHQIIRSLFRAFVEVSQILEIDNEFARKLNALIPKIAPNQIGQYGQLQEWLDDVDNPENHHRHVSHLWAVHPGNEINWVETPELFKAAQQSLIFRGDEGTGWSLAWKINFWARFLDGNHAYDLIKLLLRPVESSTTNYRRGGSYINLFDAHPPFQIDGNFGGAAGIVELLVQSHLNKIDLLPALPDALPEGKIMGVCVRGGFELSFSWENGKLKQVEVLSKAGNTCKLKYKDKLIEFDTEKGKTHSFDRTLEEI